MTISAATMLRRGPLASMEMNMNRFKFANRSTGQDKTASDDSFGANRDGEKMILSNETSEICIYEFV